MRSLLSDQQLRQPELQLTTYHDDGRTSLHCCTDRARAEQLLESKPELLEAVDDAGRTPLLAAAAAVATTVVEVLVERGADINARDGDGRNAMHYAAGGSINRPWYYIVSTNWAISFDHPTQLNSSFELRILMSIIWYNDNMFVCLYVA